jgi:hypothetical protein
VAVVRHAIFADERVLKRAGKRCHAKLPRVRLDNGRRVERATQLVELVDAPLDVGSRQRRQPIVIDNVLVRIVQHAGGKAEMGVASVIEIVQRRASHVAAFDVVDAETTVVGPVRRFAPPRHTTTIARLVGIANCSVQSTQNVCLKKIQRDACAQQMQHKQNTFYRC